MFLWLISPATRLRGLANSALYLVSNACLGMMSSPRTVAFFINGNFKKGVEIYNFGLGKGFTVLEIVKAFEKKTGTIIPYKFTSARKGDAQAIFCNSKKAQERLAWRATRNLDQMMGDIIKSL